MLYFLLILALLTFSSVYARLETLLNDFWVALDHGDIPQSKRLAGCIMFHSGEVVLLSFAVCVLERAVRFFFFLLGESANFMAHSGSP